MNLPVGRPWFGPRRYGYGVSPVTWEGWLATGVYAVALGGLPLWAGHPPSPRVVSGAIFAGTALLFGLIWLKLDRSQPLRWRWGGD